MYWLTVVLPLIDSVKTVVGCVSDGIEQGRQDIREARERANKDLFENSYKSRVDPIDTYLP